MLYSRTVHRKQYGAREFHAGYLKLQAQTRNWYCLLLFHWKNGCKNAPQCYVIRILPVLLYSVWFSECIAIISLNKKERGYRSNWNTLCPMWGTNWTTWGPNTAHLLCDGTPTQTTSSPIHNKAPDLSSILIYTVLNNSEGGYKGYFVTWKHL